MHRRAGENAPVFQDGFHYFGCLFCWTVSLAADLVETEDVVGLETDLDCGDSRHDVVPL